MVVGSGRCCYRSVCLGGVLLLVGLWPRVWATDLSEQVEIRRTAYGVPHVLGENLRAAFFGLAYCQLEDHGERVVEALVRAQGQLARYRGPDELDSDFLNYRTYSRAVETYHLQERDVRDVLEGFAAGVNAYLQRYPGEFKPWGKFRFNGYDVAALWIGMPDPEVVARFVKDLKRTDGSAERTIPFEDGSNAWALAPSRTMSGRAILLRNPHLQWDAGYYEAHVTVPGVINFYGDFRVGYPLYFNGGFNEHLGWATTNNYPVLEQVYALNEDPVRSDHYLFDGGSVAIQKEQVSIDFLNGEKLETAIREFESTPIGPVICRSQGKIYVVRSAEDGRYRKVEQFLRMMTAKSLEEWKGAMRIRAQTGSNFTYADREGNIFYLWNASIPDLPHPSGGQTVVSALKTGDIWLGLVPFERLPQLLNPRSGYLQNANDPFHYANLDQILSPKDFPENLPEPRLRLRSQLSLDLIRKAKRVSLEDVVKLKHSPRMLLAERVKPDLLEAVRASGLDDELREAVALLEKWDDTASIQSKGALLFETWWTRYFFGEEGPDWGGLDEIFDTAFAVPWSEKDPLGTPRGLSDPGRAVSAFRWAVEDVRKRYGAVGIGWGDVHRVRIGEVDAPVAGCPSWLGCFRVLSFREQEDGRQAAFRGDGWVLAVEFTDPPRAYSILAYGQSSREGSPHSDDQAEMFAAGTLKKVAFTESSIEEQLVRRYHPGRESEADRKSAPTLRGRVWEDEDETQTKEAPRAR